MFGATGRRREKKVSPVYIYKYFIPRVFTDGSTRVKFNFCIRSGKCAQFIFFRVIGEIGLREIGEALVITDHSQMFLELDVDGPPEREGRKAAAVVGQTPPASSSSSPPKDVGIEMKKP